MRPYAARVPVDQLVRAGQRKRYPLALGLQRGRLRLRLLAWDLLLQLLLLLLGRDRGLDAVAPLLLEIERVLLIDIFLFFGRRIGTCDVEAAVLHEVVISIAAAGLATTCEFGIAVGKRRNLLFLAGRRIRGFRAILEIDRRALPPLCRRTRRLQQSHHGQCCYGERSTTQYRHGHLSPSTTPDTIGFPIVAILWRSVPLCENPPGEQMVASCLSLLSRSES